MAIYEQPEQLISRLAKVPGRIQQAIDGRELSELYRASSEDEWSAVQIFAHIRACDDIFSHRIYAILVRDNTPMTAYDERRWEAVARYTQSDFHSSLALYTQSRAELVDMLVHIAADDWQRSGVHEVRGQICLQALVQGWVEHEEEHCAQLAALMLEYTR